MPSNQRLPDHVLQADLDCITALKAIAGYAPSNPADSLAAITELQTRVAAAGRFPEPIHRAPPRQLRHRHRDTDWQPQETATPGIVQFDDACRAPLNPAELENLPPIGTIQGAGAVAAALNQNVTFRGIVTGVYEDRNTAGTTFYTAFVQDIPGYEDGDPATSDGIAIFLGRERPSFQMGDQVRVSGLVTEFFGLTEIDDNALQIKVELSGQPLPLPVLIDPPAAPDALAAYFEPLEGMRGQIADPARVVGPTFSSCGLAVVAPAVSTPGIFRRVLSQRT